MRGPRLVFQGAGARRVGWKSILAIRRASSTRSSSTRGDSRTPDTARRRLPPGVARLRAGSRSARAGRSPPRVAPGSRSLSTLTHGSMSSPPAIRVMWTGDVGDSTRDPPRGKSESECPTGPRSPCRIRISSMSCVTPRRRSWGVAAIQNSRSMVSASAKLRATPPVQRAPRTAARSSADDTNLGQHSPGGALSAPGHRALSRYVVIGYRARGVAVALVVGIVHCGGGSSDPQLATVADGRD